MLELIPITVWSLILAALSHYYSDYDILNNRYIRKDRFFFCILTVIMIGFAGLRTGYNDTGTYLYGYNTIPEGIGLTDGLDWFKFGENPGFWFTQRLLKQWGFSEQSFLMFFSIIAVGLHLWFIRKYSRNIFLSILLFIAFAGYIFTLAAIKQCTAMALCLVATDRAINKKYIRFVFWVLLATLFHPYSLMYLIVPLLRFRPWGKGTAITLLLFAFIGIGLTSILETLLDLTTLMGEGYDTSSFTGEGVNPIRLLITWIPTILSFFMADQIAESEDEEQYFMLNLAVLNAGIMFVALFGTANYFARLANYFLPFQAITLPWLFTHCNPSSKRIITGVAAVGYLLFYIYSQAIHESFDYHFYSITFGEYLESLLTGGSK